MTRSQKIKWPGHSNFHYFGCPLKIPWKQVIPNIYCRTLCNCYQNSSCDLLITTGNGHIPGWGVLRVRGSQGYKGCNWIYIKNHLEKYLIHEIWNPGLCYKSIKTIQFKQRTLKNQWKPNLMCACKYCLTFHPPLPWKQESGFLLEPNRINSTLLWHCYPRFTTFWAGWVDKFENKAKYTYLIIINLSNSLLIKQNQICETIIQSPEISPKDKNKISNLTFKMGCLCSKEEIPDDKQSTISLEFQMSLGSRNWFAKSKEESLRFYILADCIRARKRSLGSNMKHDFRGANFKLDVKLVDHWEPGTIIA